MLNKPPPRRGPAPRGTREAVRVMIRTSATHPLRIDAVDTGQGRGQIGITFAPGKDDPDAISGHWARDLTADLDAIAAWKAKAVVTLIEPHEISRLCISNLGPEIQSRGMEWVHMPIIDVSTPGPEFETKWPEVSGRLRSRLAAGENILVHCRGGLGRARMVAARLLVETGADPEDAMERVRAVRPRAIETRQQEQWVRSGRRSFRG
jgi:ADP-ribosyl-[dinitrogen reductase] hydrolase